VYEREQLTMFHSERRKKKPWGSEIPVEKGKFVYK